MIIDAHHHLWDLAVRDQPWIAGEVLAPLRRDFGLDDLRAVTTPNGVAKTVVVQTVTEPEETPELLALAATDDLIAGVVGWADITAPDVEKRLAELSAAPGGRALVGIRHQVQLEPDPDWLLRRDVLRGLRHVAAAGLAYDLVVRRDQIRAAVQAATEVPALPFVLDHLGKPAVAAGELEPWASAIRELALRPNTVCKLSGLVTEADWTRWKAADLRPYADTVLDAFGPERLMFGSDWPVCTLAASYAEVLSTAHELADGLNQEERNAVFGGTASRVYGV
jgi:L-fuconolactonase